MKELLNRYEDMPTYYPSLDNMTTLYRKGSIGLVTGRTSQAKTCFRGEMSNDTESYAKPETITG